jgi:AraC-like DNA-binding protein
VQLHYAEGVTVDAMAAHAKLGERTFLRRFRKATGLKPNEYVQHVRMAKAREALEFSAQSISEIAWEVGYEDQGAFRKIFNQIVGLSPGEYRKRFGISLSRSAAYGTWVIRSSSMCHNFHNGNRFHGLEGKRREVAAFEGDEVVGASGFEPPTSWPRRRY